MNSRHVFIGLVLLNLVVLAIQLAPARADQPAGAAADVAPIVRARAFELVDERGRVRAEIKVHPAEPNLKMPDGSVGYPETVLLRLIDSQGGPNVKLAATEDGAGMSLGGQEGAYVQALSRGGAPFVKIVNSDKREQVMKP